MTRRRRLPPLPPQPPPLLALPATAQHSGVHETREAQRLRRRLPHRAHLILHERRADLKEEEEKEDKLKGVKEASEQPSYCQHESDERNYCRSRRPTTPHTLTHLSKFVLRGGRRREGRH